MTLNDLKQRIIDTDDPERLLEILNLSFPELVEYLGDAINDYRTTLEAEYDR